MKIEVDKLTEIGTNEKKNEKINWKYFYSEEDIVMIPKFNYFWQTIFSFTQTNGR